MSNTYFVVFLVCSSSSCVPNVASFSGLSIVDHTFCIRYRLMKKDCTYWVPVNRVSDTYLPYLFRLLLFHISITRTTVTITMTTTPPPIELPIIVHGKGSPYLSEKRGLRN
jgi:hypothetical protein